MTFVSRFIFFVLATLGIACAAARDVVSKQDIVVLQEAAATAQVSDVGVQNNWKLLRWVMACREGLTDILLIGGVLSICSLMSKRCDSTRVRQDSERHQDRLLAPASRVAPGSGGERAADSESGPSDIEDTDLSDELAMQQFEPEDALPSAWRDLELFGRALAGARVRADRVVLEGQPNEFLMAIFMHTLEAAAEQDIAAQAPVLPAGPAQLSEAEQVRLTQAQDRATRRIRTMQGLEQVYQAVNMSRRDIRKLILHPDLDNEGNRLAEILGELTRRGVEFHDAQDLIRRAEQDDVGRQNREAQDPIARIFEGMISTERDTVAAPRRTDHGFQVLAEADFQRLRGEGTTLECILCANTYDNASDFHVIHRPEQGGDAHVVCHTCAPAIAARHQCPFCREGV